MLLQLLWVIASHTEPTLLLYEIETLVIYGLCFFLGWRGVGAIDPINWKNQLVALPLLLCLSAIYAVRYYLMAKQVHDAGRDFSNIGVVAVIQLSNSSLLACCAALGCIMVLSLRRANLNPSKLRLYKLLLLLRERRIAYDSEWTKLQPINWKRGAKFAAAGVIVILVGLSVTNTIDRSSSIRWSPSSKTYAYEKFASQAWQVFTPIGVALLIWSWRYFQLGGDVVLASDKRKPILFLRSFEDDEKVRRFSGHPSQLIDFSLETRFANYFRHYGPFIAVGSPEDAVPQIGAARVKLSEENWQGAVVNWIITARTVVMFAGKTNWVKWELKNIVERQLADKLLLVFPPGRSPRRSKRLAESQSRLEHVRDAFAESKWAAALATVVEPETLRAICFHDDGAIMIVRSKNHGRDSYHLAAMVAHYEILRPSAPSESGLTLAPTGPLRWPIIVVGILGALALLLDAKTFWDSRYGQKSRQDWARTQNNLGNTLQNLGTRSGAEEGRKLLEDAVAAYRSALEVYTKADLPQDWARTQNNLGLALRELGRRSSGGEEGLLLEDAVAAYRSALEVYTEADLPQDWARTQNNLGLALWELGRRSSGGEKGLLLEEAVAAYRSALEVYTKADLPQDWARTQNNLGLALWELGRRSSGGEEGRKLLEEAVAAYRSALEVYTKADLPQDWARTQNNLGLALWELGRRSSGGEEGRKLLEDAVAAYRSALEVYTKADLPQGWARTQNNLGLALRELGDQLKAEEGLKRQRESVQTFREVMTYQPSDPSRLMLAQHLGDFAFKLLLNRQFAEAQTQCEAAQRLVNDIGNGIEKTDRDDLILIQGNLAHALLFQGHYGQALAIYRENWNKPLNGKTFGETTLEDFAAFNKAGLNDPDLSRMKQALGELVSEAPSP
jgi:tetratricopeptide (TPR) repeat protein